MMAETQAKAEEGSAGKKEPKAVRYEGLSDVIEIDKASWSRVGVEDQDKVVWDAKNGHVVKQADLSKGALEFLKTDGRFKIDD
jgi:formylmethanofuran dehydrogenase subunit D